MQAEGQVTITVADVTKTVDCSPGSGPLGSYETTLDVSSVSSDSLTLSAKQGAVTATPASKPVNDRTAIASTPTILDQNLTNGDRIELSVTCTEVGEVLTFEGTGLAPSQTHICATTSPEEVTLDFESSIETGDTNPITLSSVDKNGNPTLATTDFNLPIDNKAPVVTAVNNGPIIKGNTATFTITVTDENIDSLSYNVSVNPDGTAVPTSCTDGTCIVNVTGASAGTLTLTVEANTIADDVGNLYPEILESTLTVQASALAVYAPAATLQNAASYLVNGSCDENGGRVTITVTGLTEQIVDCLSDASRALGSYTATFNVSTVSSDSLTITAVQGTNTASPDSDPVNDQTAIASTPTIGDQALTNANSLTLNVTCNEVGEVLTFEGTGLRPNQTHTCGLAGTSEPVTLNFTSPIETANPNPITISSVDANGNETLATTNFNLPIDHVAPTAVIANGGPVLGTNPATFTITVTDENIKKLSYNVLVDSGATADPLTCTANPCTVTVTGASAGTLTLTVAANEIADDTGNLLATETEGSLEVQASALTVNDAPTATIQNAATYPVSGNCDANGGSVTVTVADVTGTAVACSPGGSGSSLGSYQTTLDISSVSSDPLTISATQGSNEAAPASNPVNDQTAIAKAPEVDDQNPTNANSIDLRLTCSEIGEVLTFEGTGLAPSQTHPCVSAGTSELVTLHFVNPTETANPNIITISSVDENGNETLATTEFNLPIDHVAPVVAITNTGDITQGENASFSTTVTDKNIKNLSYDVSVISSNAIITLSCNHFFCGFTQGRPPAGILTLRVAVGSVRDDAGNSNLEPASSSLMVHSSLTVASAPIVNTQNAEEYLVSGACDADQGDVTVTVADVADVTDIVECTPGSPEALGSYMITLDVSSVSLNTLAISVKQGVNTASSNPINDQTPIANAPAVSDQGFTNEESIELSVTCSEVGEVLTFKGEGLNPSTQTHTCASTTETVTLSFESSVETMSTNPITLSSLDVNGNPTTTNTTFILPIDQVAPRVAIANDGAILEGNNAIFTITVTDGNIENLSYTVTPSSGTATPPTCTASSCEVSVSGASTGTLTLSVAANAVRDDAGNSNLEPASSSLMVQASSLTVASAPTANTQNAANYPVNGNCDVSEGRVTITVADVTNIVDCTPGGSGALGSYMVTLDISSVSSSDSLAISAEQGANTVFPTSNPVNDQTPIANAPAVADQNITNEESIELSVTCNEIDEVLTFRGEGLNPDTQTHTCASTTETVTLSFESPVETSGTNPITLSSLDANRNPTETDTIFNLPIDHVAPVVAITNSVDIVEGNNATFTITVTDDNITSLNYAVSVDSGGTATPPTCIVSPCEVSVSGASTGTLTLSVAASAVTDDAGNSNLEPASSSLMVQTLNLSIDSNLPVVTTLNAANYPVNGVCDPVQGDVTVGLSSSGTVLATTSCVDSGGVGSYTTSSIDLSSVSTSSIDLYVQQGANTVFPTSNPVNDQTPIANAPAVADQNITNEESIELSVTCNEIGEVLTFRGEGLNSGTQTHTCASIDPETVTLSFENPVETSGTNPITLSSLDANGNPTEIDTIFNLPIDHIVPKVQIIRGHIIDVTGVTPVTLEITVLDKNIENLNYAVSASSGTITPSVCTITTNPCAIVVTGANIGLLTFTVAANTIRDDAGNAIKNQLQSRIWIRSTNLSIDPNLPVVTTLNAANYPLNGACDNYQGDVTVMLSPSNTVLATTSCVDSVSGVTPGTYTTSIDLSSVTNFSDIYVQQAANTASPTSIPINDQTPIANAPAVSDQGFTNEESIELSVTCNEIGEVLTFRGEGLNSGTQTHTCASIDPETVTLSFESPVETSGTNPITLSSLDANGNPTTTNTTFILPIDHVAPRVAITNSGDIGQGNNATFTIDVEEGNIASLNYTVTPSSGVATPSTCKVSSCEVSVSGASTSTLTLTVAANQITDLAGNTNLEAESTLNVELHPIVLSSDITSTKSWYVYPDTVTIQVVFSESVEVAGTPRIPVTLTSGPKNASYVSGSGTNKLNFNFTVATNDEQCNGNLSLGALDLNSGSIVSSIDGQASDNSELPSSLSGAKIDAVKPTQIGPLDISANDAIAPGEAVTTSWVSQSDNCSVHRVYMSMGTHDGSHCNDIQGVAPRSNIGNVTITSYQPRSGVLPFFHAHEFTLYVGTSYCTAVNVVDSAGNTSFPLLSDPWQAASALRHASGAYEYSDGTQAQTCEAYRTSSSYDSEGSSTYRIDPDGAGGLPPFVAYCEMLANEGWTLLASSVVGDVVGDADVPVVESLRGVNEVGVLSQSQVEAIAESISSIRIKGLLDGDEHFEVISSDDYVIDKLASYQNLSSTLCDSSQWNGDTQRIECSQAGMSKASLSERTPHFSGAADSNLLFQPLENHENWAEKNAFDNMNLWVK